MPKDFSAQTTQFLKRLEREAQIQAQLSSHRLLPRQLDELSAFVATHVWQVSLFAAVVTAMAVELLRL